MFCSNILEPVSSHSHLARSDTLSLSVIVTAAVERPCDSAAYCIPVCAIYGNGRPKARSSRRIGLRRRYGATDLPCGEGRGGDPESDITWQGWHS